MNKTYKFPALWMMCLMLFSCLTFTACDNGDDEDTNQYKGGISLNVFGPSPVSRGGVLRFLGSGMDKVTAVAIPGCDDITDIEVVSDTEIRVTVPQTAQPGLVVLKTPKGDITTKTELTFTEPIALEAFAPAEVKPGSELTITGEYLNLIKEVIFADEVTVPADEFVSQSRQEIKVIVPDSAQTGKFILSDGAEIPNWIYSEGELEVTLPSVEAPLDLVDKKPGDVIRVSGENFDLVKKVQMPNGDEVEFTMTASSEGDELTSPNQSFHRNSNDIPRLLIYQVEWSLYRWQSNLQFPFRINPIGDFSSIRQDELTGLSRIRNNNFNLLTALTDKLISRHCYLVSKYHFFNQIQIFTSNGQFTTRLYFCRCKSLQSNRLRKCQLGFCCNIPFRSLQDNQPRLGCLGYSDTDFRITDHFDVCYIVATGNSDRSHFIHATA
jgi:hypothetical protein